MTTTLCFVGYLVISFFTGMLLSLLLGGTQRDRDIAAWCALFWPVTLTLVAIVLVVFCAAGVVLGPAYIGANILGSKKG